MGIVGGEGIYLEQKEREREVTEEGTTTQCFHLHSSLIKLALCVTVCPQIILYTAKDHPHHSLYIVLAMGNAPKDDEYPLRGYVCGSRKAKSRRTSTAGGGGGSHSVDEVRMPLKFGCK